VKDALECIDWSSIGNTKTFQGAAFLSIATAIIAEHSFFIWKQAPSKSPNPFKISFDKFKSSAAFYNIQNPIQRVDQANTEVVSEIVKIALDNCLREF
ncbi:hypothetical protein K443DRAFT_102106, partial [Laccaria amethystina LaAM-08-1]